MTLEGILYSMKTGYPWRDLPLELCFWNTVFVASTYDRKRRFKLPFKLLIKGYGCRIAVH